MKLSLKKKSPIQAGIYPVRVTGITKTEGIVTKTGIRDKYEFSFVLIREEGILEYACGLLWSNYEQSPFAQFLIETAKHYELPPNEELDTDIFIGKTVWAKFCTYRDKGGNEYPSIEWFAPYESNINEKEVANNE